MGKQGKRINENEDRIREKNDKTLKIKDNIRKTRERRIRRWNKRQYKENKGKGQRKREDRIREKREKTVGNGGWDKGKEEKSR